MCLRTVVFRSKIFSGLFKESLISINIAFKWDRLTNQLG